MPIDSAHSPTPARRADAARNRARILDVARAAFAGGEGDVSMAEISRRAGLGMATLYRNFPGRRELLEALYVDEVNAVCAVAAELTEAHDDPGTALFAWLAEVFAFLIGKHRLAGELLSHSERGAPFFSENRNRVLAAGRPLLEAAERAGAVRSGLSLDQILDLTAAVTRIEGEPEYVRPILDAALAGLRAPA